MSGFVLIGAGGHAKILLEILVAAGERLEAYIDPHSVNWVTARHLADESDLETLPLSIGIVLGFGGVEPKVLARRRLLFERLTGNGRAAAPIVHPSAMVSRTAIIEPGAQILAGAIVQPGARIGAAAIINSGAVVEHDSEIGAGAHVAPRAIILADCTVGRDTMVGAGAVVLAGQAVADAMLIKALSRYPAAQS